MKIPTTDVSCAICGGSGIAIQDAESAQRQCAILTHTDPRICITVLENAAIEKQEKNNEDSTV